VFLKVLRALPKDLNYKPHDRSPSAQQLVWTVTSELKALIDVVDTGKSEWQDSKPPSLDEMIGLFEKWSTELLDKVAALDDASQERNAQFLYQGTGRNGKTNGRTSLGFYVRRDPSSWAAECLYPTHGREGAFDLWTVG
jgi:hypothetical protein